MTGNPTRNLPSLGSYHWQSLWPEGTTSPEWSHSGIEVLPGKRIVFSAPGGGDLVILSLEDGKTTMLPTGLLEIHGISLDGHSPLSIWLADPGEKPRPMHAYQPERRPGRVLKFGVDGPTSTEFTQPHCHQYDAAPWRPTSVVADDDDGVWVADGYGASLVHRFDRTGRLQFTLTGAETGRPFDCPHGLVIDRRQAEPRLVVADRGNRRLVFYHLDGGLDRIVEDPLITSPSCLAVLDGHLLFTELYGGILALDTNDALTVVIAVPDGERDSSWPNATDDRGPVRPALHDDRLNSPHGIATGEDGSVYVTEWMIGGRQVRLRPVH